MKIGIDFHGVIDRYPDLFSEHSRVWIAKGYEVHIITGREWDIAGPKVDKLNVSHTHHYSIVDFHQRNGTVMEKRKNSWWMDEEVWQRSKGEYCSRQSIDVHFDNDLNYARYFPPTCRFVWVHQENHQLFLDMLNSL